MPRGESLSRLQACSSISGCEGPGAGSGQGCAGYGPCLAHFSATGGFGMGLGLHRRTLTQWTGVWEGHAGYRPQHYPQRVGSAQSCLNLPKTAELYYLRTGGDGVRQLA